MNITTSSVGNLLLSLFSIHNRVSLPGLGAFVSEYQPATFSDDAKHMSPPSKKVIFSKSEVWNDGYLENALAVKGNITKEEAKKDLAAFVEKISTDLNSGKKIAFKGFGSLKKKADESFQFEIAAGVNLLPESFGLPELELTPVASTPLTPITPLSTPLIKPLEAPAYTPPKPINIKPAVTPKSPIAPPTQYRRSCSGIWCWILLAVVVILVASAVIFKEQLGKLYDQWYYTPAERELLKEYQAGKRG